MESKHNSNGVNKKWTEMNWTPAAIITRLNSEAVESLWEVQTHTHTLTITFKYTTCLIDSMSVIFVVFFFQFSILLVYFLHYIYISTSGSHSPTFTPHPPSPPMGIHNLNFLFVTVHSAPYSTATLVIWFNLILYKWY